MHHSAAELILSDSSTFDLQPPIPTPKPVATAFLINITSNLNQLYHFKNIIIYVSERLSLEKEGALEFFRNFRKTFPTATNLLLRRNYNASISLTELISTPSLVMVFTTERDDPIMEVAAESLVGLRDLKTIFILFPQLLSTEYFVDFETHTLFSEMIKTIYEWVWSKQFINTILLTIRDNVYIQEPYPTPVVVNKTEDWRTEDFFKRYYADMKGYVVSSPIMYDMPRVFLSDRTTNVFEHTYVRGTSGMLFLTFLKYVNATLLDTTANYSSIGNLNMSYLLTQVQAGVYETLVHSWTAMGNSTVGQSYPLGINDWCIMVPYQNGSDDAIYMRKSYKPSTWLLLLCALAYMSVVVWWCSPRRPRDFVAAIMQSICSLTNNAPISIIKTPTARMRLLFFLLFVIGIVSSTMYISKMASYLTSPPPVAQINSMEDVIDADLRIMVMDFEYKHMMRRSSYFSPRFMQQIDIVEKGTMDIYRDSFNASFGYSVTTDRWHFLDMQQDHLRFPLFRMTSICSGPFYHLFALQTDSHLRKPLKHFIIKATQAGLNKHWTREAFWEAVHLRLQHVAIVNEEPKPLSLSFFTDIVHIWWIGLILAGFVFAVEMKWYKHVKLRPPIRLSRKPRSFLRRFIRL